MEERSIKVDKLEKNIKKIIMWGGWFLSIVIALWNTFSYYNKISEELKVIQKSTLRNTIWNENIPMHDRIESCDSYISLGYNSETKKYCDILLTQDNL